MNISIHNKWESNENVFKNKIVEKLLNNLCLDERVTDGVFDVNNNIHMEALREYLTNKGIEESVARDFSNTVLEAGKHPHRQAFNLNGILVTFPTPQHKQNAIRRGTHFEKDPTKGKPNLFTDDEGKPKRGPGRPRKDDSEKSSSAGDYTPPAEGGGQSIAPSGGASSLPLAGANDQQAPASGDSATTTTAPQPAGEDGTDVPAQQEPPNVMPPKPEKERTQDYQAVKQMIAAKDVALGSPLGEIKQHIAETMRLLAELENK